MAKKKKAKKAPVQAGLTKTPKKARIPGRRHDHVIRGTTVVVDRAVLDGRKVWITEQTIVVPDRDVEVRWKN